MGERVESAAPARKAASDGVLALAHPGTGGTLGGGGKVIRFRDTLESSRDGALVQPQAPKPPRLSVDKNVR
jgi:hypothetical protein